MKKLFTLLMGLILFSTIIVAQTTPNLITVDKNKLTLEMQQQLEQARSLQETEAKIKQYGDWVGMGSELGIAVRDGLTAVKDVSIELSESDLGKFTMFLIAYKVVGKDIIRISIGLLLILISVILVSKSYFGTFKRKVLTSNPGWFKYPKEYTLINPTWPYPNAAAVTHVLVIAVMVGISAIIMFA